MKTTKEIARELGLLRRRSSTSQHTRDMRKAQSCSQEFSFLVVIDFESTCWKEKEMNTCQEIIEFPAVLLNTSTGAIEDEFHSYVLPMERPQLSKFCTEFTGITQDMVEGGAPLCVILSQFLKWLKKMAMQHNMEYHTTKDNQNLCTLVTWSDWDLGLCLHRECLRKQLFKPVVLNSWIDLRATYKKFYERKPNGLNGALQDVGIQFTGRQHSGLDDARNTAQLAWKMICDGCKMCITKTLQKASVSGGLQRARVSGDLEIQKPPAHLVNPSVALCLQKPCTSASCSMPGASTRQRPGTSASCSMPGASTRQRPSISVSLQNQNTPVCYMPNVLSNLQKPSASASLQNPITPVCPQNSGASKRNALTNLPIKTGVSASFQRLSDRKVLKKTMTSRFRPNVIDRNRQRDIQKDACQKLCNKNSQNNTTFLGKENQVGSREKKGIQKSISLYKESEVISENVLPVCQDGNIDLNAGFIHDNEQEKIINSGEDKSVIKPFNPLQNYSTPRILKHPMKTPFTKVKIFQAHKLHSDFKPPGQSKNTILSYIKCNRKVVQDKVNNHIDDASPGSLKSLHQTSLKNTTSAGARHDRTPPTSAITTPTWNSSSCIKEKITPPMCRCGRRTRRKIASRPGPDQNRPFFVCPKSNGYQVKERSGCGYFQWESSVIKKTQNIYQLNKNITGRLLAGNASTVPSIGTTPLNSNFKCSIAKSHQILKQSARTAFRIKPY